MNMFKDMLDLNEKFIELGMEFKYDKKVMQERLGFLAEEIGELQLALEADNKPEMLDALVDLVVVAMGTAIQMDFDFARAWARVHHTNMSKYAVKNEAINNRQMSFDLKKPDDWTAPYLEDLV